MIFGPRKVIVDVGANMIVRNVEEAFKRVRNVCVPLDHSPRYETPLPSVPGSSLCQDGPLCRRTPHPWKICNYTTIIEGVRQTEQGRMNVILVGEKLGI
jgi:hypothetical protein